MIRNLFLTVLCLITLPAMAQDKVFHAKTFTLDNGMRGVVIPNTRAPVVTHMVWYGVGAADEPRGKSGIAHFLEHLLFKGSTYIDANGETVTLPPGAFSKTVKTMGGRDNAFTSQDFTAYFQSVPVAHLETVMRMEAGRMRGVVWDQDSFLPERQVILEERAGRTDTNPQARLYEHIMQIMYPNHPYGIPIIGWRHEIAALEMQDAQAMYKQYYAPNNAILVISGDIDVATAQAMAERAYGGIPRSDSLPARVFTDIPPLDARPNLVMHDETVRQPVIMMAARVDNAVTNPENALALEVFADILGNGSSSRLYKSLVIDQKIASNVSVGYSAESRDLTTFFISASPLPDAEVETIRSEIENIIHDIIANGVTDEDVAQSVTRMQDAAVFARDSLQGPAMIIGRALSAGVSLEQVETWPARIATVTPDQVQTVARQYFHDGRDDTFIVHAVLLPETAEEGSDD